MSFGSKNHQSSQAVGGEKNDLPTTAVSLDFNTTSVRIHAAGTNQSDVSSVILDRFDWKEPILPGYDFAYSTTKSKSLNERQPMLVFRTQILISLLLEKITASA
ncbi:predicted protein [Sclerotinia sclerotiorum 1980 UF-70]|uniref:Uncharacterized protein n=1 Tax=Sclerotinia sclerotiorum (strain ATCC 18683 / 1980 / Ss-1) TaxID=665079 RepID=A7EVE9_SCLS1|nr:predicted protein [Sclerotinia sclerotiorum 1980 UF-70]EDN93441.1 predicted protein [Sclerotinia sclerotiorum 1980 UF-70]